MCFGWETNQISCFFPSVHCYQLSSGHVGVSCVVICFIILQRPRPAEEGTQQAPASGGWFLRVSTEGGNRQKEKEEWEAYSDGQVTVWPDRPYLQSQEHLGQSAKRGPGSHPLRTAQRRPMATFHKRWHFPSPSRRWLPTLLEMAG